MALRITHELHFAKRLLALLGLVSVMLAPQARSQTTTAASPLSGGNLEFEVVSIKPNHSGQQGSVYGAPRGDRFTFTNVTLQMLVKAAYRLQDFQIAGGPSWLDSERYDIVAKFDDPNRPPPQLMQMLQAMLAKRFLLAVHMESKEMPIYSLVKAREDTKIRPRLQKSSDEPCPAVAPSAGASPVCGQLIFARNRIKGQKAPLSSLAAVLSTITGRTVVDRTGLGGRFDLDLEWTPDETLPTRGLDAGAPQADAAEPSLFTALQEQLGLKLDSQKGAVEVLVIDHAEKPSEN